MIKCDKCDDEAVVVVNGYAGCAEPEHLDAAMAAGMAGVKAVRRAVEEVFGQ